MGENSQSCEKDIRLSLSLYMTKLSLKGEGKGEHPKEFIMHYKVRTAMTSTFQLSI